MPNKIRKRISILCIALSLMTLLLFVILICQRPYAPDIAGSIVFMLLFAISLLLGVSLFNKSKHPTKRERNLRYMWLALYLFYVIQMLYMLFFARDFARDYVNLNEESYMEALQNQYNLGTNFVPLATIHKMMAIFSIPTYANSIAIINLFGNFIAFMPNAFFMFVLSKKASNPWRFAFAMAGLIIAVEGMQFLTLTGSMDIDDFILNFTGVMLAYLLLRTPMFQSVYPFLTGRRKKRKPVAYPSKSPVN